jgi:hypothetical protein
MSIVTEVDTTKMLKRKFDQQVEALLLCRGINIEGENESFGV